MSVIERVEELEARTQRMEARLAALEGRRTDAPARPVEWRPMEPVVAPPPPPASFAPPVSPTPPPSPSPRQRAPRPELSLEDLLGGRVLAWAGGLSLLAGLLFLLVVAVSRGWIGEEARTALAAATSLGLLVAGIRVYEHRGHTDSALAATATGIAGLFASAVVAVQAYELIPAVAGLAVAFAVGATATWLAVRWEARGIAALGILGAVSAPVLVGGELSLSSIAFLFLATGSAVGVLLWQRWTWLAFASFALATMQWVGWLFTAEPRAPLALAVLIGFGALAVVAAVGFELRTRSDELNLASHLLLMLNALVLAWAGWAVAAGHGRARLAGGARGRPPRGRGDRPPARPGVARARARCGRDRDRARRRRVRLGRRRPAAGRRLGGERGRDGRDRPRREADGRQRVRRLPGSAGTSVSRSRRRSSSRRR